MSIYFDQEEFIKFVFQFESHLVYSFACLYRFPDCWCLSNINTVSDLRSWLNDSFHAERSFLLEYGGNFPIIAIRHNDGFYVFDNSLAARKSLMEK